MPSAGQVAPVVMAVTPVAAVEMAATAATRERTWRERTSGVCVALAVQQEPEVNLEAMDNRALLTNLPQSDEWHGIAIPPRELE